MHDRYVPSPWEIPASQLDLPLSDTIDAAYSNQMLMDARRRALQIEASRIREAEGISDDDMPPDRRQGSPRAIRDLDDVDPATKEPRLYKTASAAAETLGVTRAHHVLRAAARNGRAGGHRVCTDAYYIAHLRPVVQVESRPRSPIPSGRTLRRRTPLSPMAA